MKNVDNFRVEASSDTVIVLGASIRAFQKELPMNQYNIEMNRCVLRDEAAVVRNEALPSADNSDLLRDLEGLANQLTNREPLIANAINELRKAIQEKDEETIQEKAKTLTVGTVAEILKEVASKTVLAYLGLG